MEYYNEDQLYKYFKEAIKADSTKKMQRLRTEIDAIKERETARITLEVKRKVDWTIGSVLKEIKADHQTQVNQIATVTNKRLIALRNEYFKQLFLSVEEKLNVFTKSAEYLKLMENKIKLVLKTYDKAITFMISEDDLRLRDLIQNLTSKSVINFTNEIKIGGFRAFISDKKIIIDETIDSKVESQKESFHAKMKLFIKK